MPDTKEEILVLLMREEHSAARLADALKMTPAGIRQHLTALQAQGLIVHRKLGGEPNRPTYLYRLSESGKATFPRKYDLLAAELVRTAKGELGTEAAARLIEHAGQQVASRLAGSSGDAVTRAWEALAYLNATGTCRGDVIADPDGTLRMTLYQCPFQTVSTEHPEVCPAFFGGLFRSLLGAQAVTCTPVTEGLACCQVSASLKNA
jgi:DeoR family suf operon transcriptional repressor